MANNKKNKPFLFPQAHSTVLPDPSKFFSENLLSSPLPTNSFFENFVLKNGDQPEYIHPYLIKSSNSSLSISYPRRSSNSAVISQVFKPDLTITSSQKISEQPFYAPFLHQSFKNPMNLSSLLRKCGLFVSLTHEISSYNDISVTLDIPNSALRFFIVRGSPFLTFSVTQPIPLSITTINSIISCSTNESITKHTFHFNNGQTWILYASSPIKLSHGLSKITSEPFSGIIRIALLPESNPRNEAVLDKFSSSYSVSGVSMLREPFCVEYKWEKKGSGDLLLLAHPLHLQLLSDRDCDVTVLTDFKYQSIDGDLVGVVGDSWLFKIDPVSITWHSSKGVKKESQDEIVSALIKDVEDLNSSEITTTSSYFYGKLIARAARLALIAEEVGFLDVIPKVSKYLKEIIEPWLNGTFNGNRFLYDKKWGGIITKQGSTDVGADFGFGIYNDHHFHLGYFLYGIAVLAKIDPIWGRKYKPQAYSLMEDFMNLSTNSNSNYTCFRCFDFYKLHSWAGGLTEFNDGRNQESTSEAVNAYYSAALIGMAYDDADLIATASTLTSLEILAAKMWWHVEEEGNMYEKIFSKKHKVIGVLWSNKRDSGLWFGPAEWKDCRLGIQLLPLCPISEVLFSNFRYVKELVEWTLPALKRDGVGDDWKGCVYALQGIYDNESALQKIRKLNGFDDGNSLSNILWWIHSRGDGVQNEEIYQEKVVNHLQAKTDSLKREMEDCISRILQSRKQKREKMGKLKCFLQVEEESPQKLREAEEAQKRRERKKKEQLEFQAKLDEIAEKQKQREREIEEKAEREKREALLGRPTEPALRPYEPPARRLESGAAPAAASSAPRKHVPTFRRGGAAPAAASSAPRKYVPTFWRGGVAPASASSAKGKYVPTFWRGGAAPAAASSAPRKYVPTFRRGGADTTRAPPPEEDRWGQQ